MCTVASWKVTQPAWKLAVNGVRATCSTRTGGWPRTLMSGSTSSPESPANRTFRES